MVADVTARPVAAAVPAGFILAVMTTLGAFSYSRLIFPGPLEGYVSLGFASAMVSAVVIGFVVARKSSLPGTVAIPQDRVAPILALMAVEILTNLPDGTPPGTTAVLVMGAIGLTTLLTGGGLLLLGWLQLGNLLRFIPYPVVGGFLASSGWLLFRGGTQVLSHGQPDSGLLAWVTEAPSPVGLSIGAPIAFVLALSLRKRPRPLLVPATLVVGVAAFYLIAAGTGTSLVELRYKGLLASAIPPPWAVDFGSLHILEAPWAVLLGRSGLVASVLFTTFISILLSASAIELTTNQEADLNRELRVAGWGNLVSSMFCGMVGFHSLSLSRFALSLGIPGRLPATISALSCAALLFVGPALFGYLPSLIPGVLLMLLGLALLLEWVVDGARRFGRTDYAIVLLILITVAGAGYLAGVAVGTAAAVALFIVRYSQISVINSVADGRRVRSNVERAAWHLDILNREGERTMMMRLQGFVFFGTAAQIIEMIRARLADLSRTRMLFVVFDFERVTGLDSSAAVAFAKILRLSEKEGFRIALSGLSQRLRSELIAAGLPVDKGPVKVFPDFDHALEWCEDDVIARFHGDHQGGQPTLAEQLRRTWPRPDEVGRLLQYLEPVPFKSGEPLIRQGDISDAVYFIETGHVTARIDHGNGRFTRLRRQGGGTVVGELGFYLRISRTASVVADSDGSAYRLSRSAMEAIAKDDPFLESSIHQFMARNLAARNAFINESFHQATN